MDKTIDFNSVFKTKIAIILSTDDNMLFQVRKVHHLQKMKQMAHFTHVYDKNLAQSDSIYQLLETQKIHELSQDAMSKDQDDHKILVTVCYIGHGIWRNQSTHTFNNAQKRILDIEGALRTCAQMPNVYVLGIFDCCRQEASQSPRMASYQRQEAPKRLVTFHRDSQPSQARPCSCGRMGEYESSSNSSLDNWQKHILTIGNAEWDALATSNVIKEQKQGSWAAGYCVEQNSDLDTSNESYVSSDDEENADQQVLSTKLSREDKALIGLRFNKYFRRQGVLAEDYLRQHGQQDYQRSQWIKLTFDGQTKRLSTKPKQVDELLELAKKRFGALKYILQTEQFKPVLHFKSRKIASQIQIETTADLIEVYELMMDPDDESDLFAQQMGGKTVHLSIQVYRRGKDPQNLVPFRLCKQVLRQKLEVPKASNLKPDYGSTQISSGAPRMTSAFAQRSDSNNSYSNDDSLMHSETPMFSQFGSMVRQVTPVEMSFESEMPPPDLNPLMQSFGSTHPQGGKVYAQQSQSSHQQQHQRQPMAMAPQPMMMTNNNVFQYSSNSNINRNNSKMNQMIPGFSVMAPLIDPNDTIVMERDSVQLSPDEIAAILRSRE